MVSLKHGSAKGRVGVEHVELELDMSAVSVSISGLARPGIVSCTFFGLVLLDHGKGRKLSWTGVIGNRTCMVINWQVF